MRTYGRIRSLDGSLRWVEVSTAPNGDDSQVYITALAQTLKLNLNESPFYGTWGLPAQPAVAQQIAPDFNVSLTQQRYAPYFASLIVSRTSKGPLTLKNPPTYRINAITLLGATLTGPAAT